MFGHVKGAFTGADKRKPGKFALADSGTILLDEIRNILERISVRSEPEIKESDLPVDLCVEAQVCTSVTFNLALAVAAIEKMYQHCPAGNQ